MLQEREQARVDRATAAKAAASSGDKPLPLFAPPVKGRELTSDSTKVRRVLGRFDDVKSIVLDNQHDFIGVQQQPETPTILSAKKQPFPSLSSSLNGMTSLASSKPSSKPADRHHDVHRPPPAKSSAEQKHRPPPPHSSLAAKAGEGIAKEKVPGAAGGRDKGQPQLSKSHNGVGGDSTSDRTTSKPTPHLKIPLQPPAAGRGRPSLPPHNEQAHLMKAATNCRMSIDSIEDVFKEMDLPISSPITALPSHSPHKDQRFFPPPSQKMNASSEKAKTTVTKPVSSILADLDISSSDSDEDDDELKSPTVVTNNHPVTHNASIAPPPRLSSIKADTALSTSRSASPALGAAAQTSSPVPPAASTSASVKPANKDGHDTSQPANKHKIPAIKTSSSTSRMPIPQMPNPPEGVRSKSPNTVSATPPPAVSSSSAGLLKSQPSVTFKTATVTSPLSTATTTSLTTSTSVTCATSLTTSVTDSKTSAKSTLIASKPTTVSKVPRRLSQSSDDSSDSESEADKDSIATEAGEADQEMLDAATMAPPSTADDVAKAMPAESMDTGRAECVDDSSDTMKQARNWSLGTWLQQAQQSTPPPAKAESKTSGKVKAKADGRTKAAKEEKAANKAKAKAEADKEKHNKKGAPEPKNNDKSVKHAPMIKQEIAEATTSVQKKKDARLSASDSENKMSASNSKRDDGNSKRADKTPSRSTKEVAENSAAKRGVTTQDEKLEVMRAMLREDAATALASRKRTTSNLSSTGILSSDDEHHDSATESKRLRLSDTSVANRTTDQPPIVRDGVPLPPAAFVESEALALMSNIFMRNRSVSSDSNTARDDRESDPILKPVYHPKFGITYYNGHAEVLVRIDLTRLQDSVHSSYDDFGQSTKRALHDSRVAVVGPYKHSTALALSSSEDGHLSREASRFAEVSARLLSGANGASISPVVHRQDADTAGLPSVALVEGAAVGGAAGGTASSTDAVRFKMAAAEDVRTQLFPDMDRGLAGTRIPRRKADAAAAFDTTDSGDPQSSANRPLRPSSLAYDGLEDGNDAVEMRQRSRFAGEVTSPNYADVEWMAERDGHRWQQGADSGKASHFRPSQQVRDWDAPESRTAGDRGGASSSHHGHQSHRPPGAHIGGQWAALLAGNSAGASDGSSRRQAPTSVDRTDHTGGPESLLQLIAQNRADAADKCLQEAKRIKHEADNTSDRLVKQLKYMEAVVCFVLCGCAMENDSLSLAEPNKIFKLYDDTLRLLRNMVGYRVGSEANADRSHDKEVKLVTLSYRLQALLFLRLYKIRKPETLKLKKIIDDYNRQTKSTNSSSNGRPNNLPSPTSPQPSPAGSIGSVGSTGSAAELQQRGTAAPGGGTGVPVPQRIHSVTQQYVSHVGHLQLAHELWEQADSLATSSSHAAFFEEVSRSCGNLTIHSSMTELVRYVHAGLRRLKDAA